MARSTERDGWRNRTETIVLTRFSRLWKLAQRVPPVRKVLNRALIDRAILKTKTRPHQFSLMSPYTSWDSLTDRTYTARHLPPAPEDYTKSLPELEFVKELFRRSRESYRFSQRSTVLFTSFAQWFTDGFLRTDRTNSNKNTSNHEIDLCQIYGLIPSDTRILREMRGGRMKTSQHEDGEYPPLYYDESLKEKEEFKELKYKPVFEPGLPEARQRFLFVGGVERVNVSVGYAMMNALFLREHNRICGELAKAYPTWDDERLFQTARNILIVVLLRIVVEDYVNHITPYHFKFSALPWDFKRSSWYRTNWMTVEFNLLYRWHSMVPNAILVENEFMPIAEGLFNNELLLQQGMGAMFRSASRQRASEVGLFNTTDHLVEQAEVKSIELGRKANLRSYNDYRELFRFPRVTDWSQITGNELVQRKLRELYGSVDKLELFVGLFAEDVREGSALSPLIGRMVGVDAFSQVLTNPLLSINVFKPETFSDVGWKIIHETGTLEDVLRRNVKGEDLKGYIGFLQPRDVADEPLDLAWHPEPRALRSEGAATVPAAALQSVTGRNAFDEQKLYKK